MSRLVRLPLQPCSSHQLTVLFFLLHLPLPYPNMITNWMTAALAVLAASPMMVHAAPAPPNPDNHLAKRAWPTIVNNCVNSGQVALTFDDGPYLYENDIAGALGGSKATFFLNGNSKCRFCIGFSSVVLTMTILRVDYDCIYNHVDEMYVCSANSVAFQTYLLNS